MKQNTLKFISIFLAINILTQVCFPTIAYALSGGPSQIESQAFSPAGASEMVDLFSGDFNYDIPLLDIEGYPINLAYNSGITMDQEASWVGLGWNINPGAINRQMRGLPDEFAGDEVVKEQYIKPNFTVGVDLGAKLSREIFGLDFKFLKGRSGVSSRVNGSVSIGIFYNNYKGIGFTRNVSVGISASGPLVNIGGNFAIENNTQEGVTLARSYSIGLTLSKACKGILGFGFGYQHSGLNAVNSRSGLKTTARNSGFSASIVSLVNEDKSNGAVYAFERFNAGYGSSAINFSSQTYIPNIQVPVSTSAFSASFSLGKAFKGTYFAGLVRGYGVQNQLSRQARNYSIPSYGYLHAEKKSSDNVLLDLNREKEGPFTNNKPVLPIASHTFDLYNITGQGLMGMFRAHRGDIGVLHDNRVSTVPDLPLSLAINGELGFGNLLHFGVDVEFSTNWSESGKWSNETNVLASSLDFVKQENNPSLSYEPSYFKMIGERTGTTTELVQHVNLTEPVAPVLSGNGNIHMPILKTKYSDWSVPESFVKLDATNTHLKSRDNRTRPINQRLAAEAQYCHQPFIQNYLMNSFGSNNYVNINRQTGVPLHHITELSVLNTNGTKYVYGIPAYNHKQEEYTFTCASGGSLANGTVGYSSDNITNKKGESDGPRDGYYDATKLPKYAHSYLLTSVLSPDYVDVNQNGPDASDLGSYTKINYTQKHSNYKWRLPYHQTANIAAYQPGIESDVYDDKANILYGEKDIWYVHSIETKNYIAEFRLKKREDGFGAASVHGGVGSEALYMLESITLYTKEEKSKGLHAVPIKTVHFEYDYSLCPNVPNNSGLSVDKLGNPTSNPLLNVNINKGKLTLRKVYFTYGNSNKSRFSVYNFKYTSDLNQTKYNAPYQSNAYDRWGNYKGIDPSISNAEFPYVNQDSALTNGYLQQWTLNRIELPSGGFIDVEYEADDYAYVQNKKAMQMFKIAGFGENQNAVPTDKLYSGNNVHNYIFIDLGRTLSDDSQFKMEYLNGISKLFFTCKVALTVTSNYESIRGYAEVNQEDAGLVPGNNNRAWIKIKKVGFDGAGDDVNPIAKAAWQFARLNTPFLVYPESDLKRSQDYSKFFFRMLTSIASGIAESFSNIHRKLKRKEFGRQVDLSKSFIRLNCPTGKKLGGGLRVKRLVMNDNWNNVSNIASSISTSYGQEFEYSTEEDFNGQTRTISSGVASYEPMIGNEENPFRLPATYNKVNYLIPDDQFYVEEPFGEMFFPGANVGYSKVTVRNLQYANVTNNATGKTVHEYYTAKDFPTIPKQISVETNVTPLTITQRLFKATARSNTSATAGYSIELNDMHGKFKATWVYAQKNSEGQEVLISGIKHEYNTDPSNSSQLSNEVYVIDEGGNYVKSLVGVDVDLFVDAREEKNYSDIKGRALGLDLPRFGAIIIPIPSYFPKKERSDLSFHSMTITKVIQRYGLLTKVTVFEEGASITTTNEAFDKNTGEVLLTKTENEYGDNVFNLSTPAYWAYNNMGESFFNENLILNNVTITSEGLVLLPQGVNPNQYFVKGDEVILNGNPNRYWIDDNGDTEGTIIPVLLPQNETTSLPPAGNYVLKIIKSGKKNMLNEKIQVLTSLKSPIFNNKINLLGNINVVDVGAFEFNDSWKRNCLIEKQTRTAYSANKSIESYFHIFNYLLETGQTKLTIDSAIGCINSADRERTINRTLPGYLAYDTSFVFQRRQQTNYPHVFSENIAFCPNSSLGGQTNITYTFQVSVANGVGARFDFSYTDAGCVKSSSTKRPTRIEFIRLVNKGVVNQSLNIVVGAVARVRLHFGAGCSIITNIAFDHLPINPESILIEKCSLTPQESFNPYLDGTASIWKPKKSLVFKTERIQNAAQKNIRFDGYLSGFNPYWNINSNNKWESNLTANWIASNEIAHYKLPNGALIEAKDALGNHTATLLIDDLGNPKGKLVEAMAQNSKVSQIGFESFERYEDGNMDDYSGDCPISHWNFFQSNQLRIDSSQYHSGKFSLRLLSTESAWTQNGVFDELETNDINASEKCVMPFYPSSGEYWVSAWIKTNVGRSNAENRKGYIVITNDEAKDTLYPSGPIIEGWQRIEGKILIGVRTSFIKIALMPDPLNTTWYDDIRIQPFNSTMKTYVYDKHSFRTMAELDENNYATFYEYDEQGVLKRIKRETSKGVVTLKETKSNNFKR